MVEIGELTNDGGGWVDQWWRLVSWPKMEMGELTMMGWTPGTRCAPLKLLYWGNLCTEMVTFLRAGNVCWVWVWVKTARNGKATLLQRFIESCLCVALTVFEGCRLGKRGRSICWSSSVHLFGSSCGACLADTTRAQERSQFPAVKAVRTYCWPTWYWMLDEPASSTWRLATQSSAVPTGRRVPAIALQSAAMGWLSCMKVRTGFTHVGERVLWSRTVFVTYGQEKSCVIEQVSLCLVCQLIRVKLRPRTRGFVIAASKNFNSAVVHRLFSVWWSLCCEWNTSAGENQNSNFSFPPIKAISAFWNWNLFTNLSDDVSWAQTFVKANF